MGVEVSRLGHDVVNRPIAAGASASDMDAMHTSLLRQSSAVNGVNLPLWKDTQSAGWCNTISAEAGPSKRYGRRPALNQDQQAYQPVWRASGTRLNSLRKDGDRRDMIHSVKVEQGMGANCSVVVGLELCLKHNLKWNRRVRSDCVLQRRLEDPALTTPFVISVDRE